MTRFGIYFLAAGLWLALAVPAIAYNFADRWMATATNGPVGPVGTPITLTWSVVPDGTVIPNVFPGVNKTSDLISSFDTLLGGGGGADLTQRPWFQRIKQSFDRWSAVSGVSFVYEPMDDGAEHGSSPGVLSPLSNARGDVRLSGTFINGNSGTLAYTIFPEDGDLVIDTGDTTYYGNTATNNINLRNTVAHEIGHSLGLGHIDSNSANFLMESFNSSAFDGPQFDDIRGIQHLYGDALEKTNGGSGNNSIATATDLGALAAGQSVLRGTHAATGTFVLPNETDFLSIANQNDFDFFSFTTAGPSLVDFTLTPLGPSYNERFGTSGPYTTVTSSTDSNLSLEIYALSEGDPVLLSAANSHPAGQAESILDFALSQAGQYFVRVAGSSDTVQFYQLGIGVEALMSLSGDYNLNGTVDAADFVLWRDTFGQSGMGLAADGNGDETIDAADFDVWQMHFGETAGAGIATLATVPEPGGEAVLFTLLICLLATGRLPKRHFSTNFRPIC